MPHVRAVVDRSPRRRESTRWRPEHHGGDMTVRHRATPSGLAAPRGTEPHPLGCAILRCCQILRRSSPLRARKTARADARGSVVARRRARSSKSRNKPRESTVQAGVSTARRGDWGRVFGPRWIVGRVGPSDTWSSCGAHPEWIITVESGEETRRRASGRVWPPPRSECLGYVALRPFGKPTRRHYRDRSGKITRAFLGNYLHHRQTVDDERISTATSRTGGSASPSSGASIALNPSRRFGPRYGNQVNGDSQ